MLLLLLAGRADAALTAPSPTRAMGCRALAGRRWVPCAMAAGPEDPEKPDLDDRVQALLDRPIIDPTAAGENEPQLLRAFKQLVETDYPLAEALYAGSVLAVLLFFSQKGVSIYKHCYFMPDQQCPWAVTQEIDFWSF